MHKTRVTLSDDNEKFNAYTNGELWNGWAQVYMTKKQVTKWLDSTPYNYEFISNPRGYTHLIIYWDNQSDTYESDLVMLPNGKSVEMFALEGLEWTTIKTKGE